MCITQCAGCGTFCDDGGAVKSEKTGKYASVCLTCIDKYYDEPESEVAKNIRIALGDELNSTNVTLTPSSNGNDCIGNGEHSEIECQCDECEHYLYCFPYITEE